MQREWPPPPSSSSESSSAISTVEVGTVSSSSSLSFSVFISVLILVKRPLRWRRRWLLLPLLWAAGLPNTSGKVLLSTSRTVSAAVTSGCGAAAATVASEARRCIGARAATQSRLKPNAPGSLVSLLRFFRRSAGAPSPRAPSQALSAIDPRKSPPKMAPTPRTM